MSSSRAEASPIFAVEGLSVRFGGFQALRGVTWSVSPGRILGIIGPNGAGKSTCFMAATNMVTHTGSLTLDGADVTHVRAHRLPQLGLRRTFQQNAFFGGMTVLQNMAGALLDRPLSTLAGSVFMPWAEATRRQAVEVEARRHLLRYEIPESLHGHLPGELSYGTQRMLSIALAAAPGARVVLLDEPAAGLGGRDMLALRNLLIRMRADGLAVVLIEHHMDLVMELADEVVVIELGEVIASGPPSVVKTDPRVLEAYLGEGRMSARLEVQNLRVAYGASRAVAIDRLVVEPGTLAAVIGANGAGKSTLINAIANWSRADVRIDGAVLLDGQNVAGLPAHEHVRKGLQLVPEGRGVFMGLTVEENLRAGASTQAAAGRQTYSLQDVYALFPRLYERRINPGGSLSGGERQMLAVGRALRMAPKILLLDEPSIGLAPRLVSVLLQSIRTLVDGGLTVLLVEQNVRAAMEVTDAVHLLERGRVIASGTADAMRDDPRIIEAYLGGSHG